MTVCTVPRTAHPAVRVDVNETAEAVRIGIPVPGIAQNGLTIQVEDGVLTVAGERKAAEDGAKYLRRERRSGRIHKQYTLPKWVDAEKVSANLAGGILTVTLPKDERTRQRAVPVN